MSYQDRIQECLSDIEVLRTATEPYKIQFLTQRFELALQALVGTARPNEPGPWNVGQDLKRVYLACEARGADMGHDIRLYVDGDFYSDEARLAYASALCAQLNSL